MKDVSLESIRLRLEQEEISRLSPLAAKSAYSKGRQRPEQPSETRTEFARDRDRILHSKSFRRLKYKTQVFFSPAGDHYRTRLSHTLEVAQIARTISRALRLNEDLTEAIALGHDVGHAPFGHAGERALDALVPGGFIHSQQSLRVLEVLEKDGKGLNLTWEVRDGISYHSKHEESVSEPLISMPSTLEGCVVRVADAIAYLNADIDDAIRAGLITFHDLPQEAIAVLGSSHGERIEAMVHSIIRESWGISEGDSSATIRMESKLLKATDILRDFMFKNVYRHPAVEKEAQKAMMVVTKLYEYFASHPEEFKTYLGNEESNTDWTVADYVSGMTDRFACNLFVKLFTPQSWSY